MALLKTLVRNGVPTHEATQGDLANTLTSAGTTQADAYAITADVSIFTTVGASSGARLPNYDTNDVLLVNNGGANALALYPPTGGYINDLAQNAAYSVGVDKAVIAIRVTSTRWIVVGA